MSSTRGTLLVEVGDTCRVRAEICQAEDKTPASAAVKISDDLDVLLAFYDFPAEHWEGRAFMDVQASTSRS